MLKSMKSKVTSNKQPVLNHYTLWWVNGSHDSNEERHHQAKFNKTCHQVNQQNIASCLPSSFWYRPETWLANEKRCNYKNGGEYHGFERLSDLLKSKWHADVIPLVSQMRWTREIKHQQAPPYMRPTQLWMQNIHTCMPPSRRWPSTVASTQRVYNGFALVPTVGEEHLGSCI